MNKDNFSLRNKNSFNNAYVLFGWEAIEARPNLDPYTSSLRTIDETGQVYTSDVHLKHHVRRGIAAVAKDKFAYGHPEQAVFYKKELADGSPCSFNSRLADLRKAWGIDAKKQTNKDAFERCLDLPLFGYVHAVKNDNFNALNCINTLFRPVTFHRCRILQLGRNNAFPGEEKVSKKDASEEEMRTKSAAGSSAIDSLEYGFFLALFEINRSVLELNARNHQVIDWQDNGESQWLSLFVEGLWRAYTSDRYPSFTQRAQFAKFLVMWNPDPTTISPAQPKDLIMELTVDDEDIETTVSAKEALSRILPSFVQKWGFRPDNEMFSITAKGFDKVWQ